MDFLNHIEWYIHSSPTLAENKITGLPLTKEEKEMVVLDGSTTKKMKLILPLHDEFQYTKEKSITTPVTVKKLLNAIYTFYKEPLDITDYDLAFNGMEEWKEEVVDMRYDGDESQLIKYDVFTDTCTPDFCGLEYDEVKKGYFVSIGPE